MEYINKELFSYLELPEYGYTLYNNKKELIYRNLEVVALLHNLVRALTNLLEYKSNVSSHYINDMIRKILRVIKSINIKNDKHLKGKNHIDLNIKENLKDVVIVFEELCKYYYLVQDDLSDIANKALLKAINYIKEFLVDMGIYSISRKDFENFDSIYFKHNAINDYVANSQINISYNFGSDRKGIVFNNLPYYVNAPNKELVVKGDVTINIPCLTRKKNK